MTEADFDSAFLEHALPLLRSPGRSPLRFALALLGFMLRYARLVHVSPARWRARLAALPEGRHLYFFGTLQQQRALERIASVDAEACVIDRARLPRKLVRRLALAAVPVAWRVWRKASPEHRARLSADPKMALLAAAYHAAWRQILATVRPRCLVVASDTGLGPRAAVYAMRAAGVPSLYVQHGCVTPAAPPLITDYALLDGDQALQTYRAVGMGVAKPSLVGVPRVGGSYRARRGTGAIGVCGTHLTPIPVLLDAAHALRRRFPGRGVVVRPHPRQSGHWRFRLGLAGFTVSDPLRVTGPRFLDQVDVVVAGSSSILMEAALLGVGGVYCRALDARPAAALSNETAFDVGKLDYSDYYGFVAAGLCDVAADLATLPDVVARVDPGTPARRAAARRFCDTVGGPHEGRSHELAARCVGLAARREPLPLRWDS